MDIKLYKSPWKAIRLMLLCSVFVLGGLFLTNTDAPEWVRWATICFFSLGYPVGMYHLLDRRPQIIINEIGIFDRTTYKDFINWEIIQDAYLINLRGQKFVCIVVDKIYEPSYKKGEFSKLMSHINKEIGAQELNIQLGQIKIDEAKLIEFIQKMINTAPKNRREYLDEKLLQ